MNKIIVCLFIINYSIVLNAMNPSFVHSGSSDSVRVRRNSESEDGNCAGQVPDRFLLIMRNPDGNEKMIDWKKLIPRSLIQNPEHELHPYNQQLKDVAERGFNRMLKEDCLDFSELERVVLENKLSFLLGFENSMQSIFERIETFHATQQKIIDEANQLREKNAMLERANKDVRSKYHEVDLEYRKLCDDYNELSGVQEQLQKEKNVLSSQLQAAILTHQALVRNHDETLVYNKKLLDENNQLRALLEQTKQKQMVRVVGSEAHNPMEASQHLDEEKQSPEAQKGFRFERRKEDENERSNQPFFVFAPRLQQKSRLRLFCALFVTGGMLWGLKYFFNK